MPNWKLRIEVCDRVGYLFMDSGRCLTSEPDDAATALHGRFVSHNYTHDQFRDEVVSFALPWAQQTYLKQDPPSNVPG